MKHMQLEQKRIRNLFSDGRNTFSFPFYQRVYEWDVDQCHKLWDDLFTFAFPDGNAANFNPDNDEYFLGNIVICHTDTPSHFEIVDGQQRCITLALLIRALHEDLHEHKKSNMLSDCLWLTTENGDILPDQPRITLTIEMDRDKDEFPSILTVGYPPSKSNSRYAKNYRFFRKEIAEFKQQTPSQLWNFAFRILENAYLNILVIDDREHANQLFLTINDRGKSLTPADLFKGVLYMDANSKHGEKGVTAFLDRWDGLDARCRKIFKPNKEMSPIEFIYFIYEHQHYFNLRRDTSLKNYSANNAYKLKQPETLNDIESLSKFLVNIALKKSVLFDSPSIDKKIYTILHFPGDAYWYLFAAYFFKSGLHKGSVTATEFEAFLDYTIAYFVGHAICGNGYSLTKPTRPLKMLEKYLDGALPEDEIFEEQIIRYNLHHFTNVSSRDRAAKILLYWWTFQHENQELPQPNTVLSVEHIFAKKLASQRVLESEDHIELLGNLALLEKSLNEKAQNFGFTDKIPVYLHGAWGKCTDGTFNEELKLLAQTKTDFTEPDILIRNEQIISVVLDMLARYGLLKK